MTLHRLILTIAALSTTLWAGPALAADAQAPCTSAADRACIAARILREAPSIEENAWRDASLRDLASSLTHDGRVSDALAIIPTIGNPDTQAMAVRGIGMTAALYGKYSPDQLRGIFTDLAATSRDIAHPAAAAIAQTYIAMAQAFAGLDDDAWATAAGIGNPALKHKAFGETAEIQAERGDATRAMLSIGQIDSIAFRNKSYQTVAEILIKKGAFDDALQSAQHIDNTAKRVQTLQKILKGQEDRTKGPRNDAAAETAAETDAGR